ncbi:P-loop containing nucleoside triphosphate hydrolase protein [Crassisporium funariophilum]|nr:P-loop containing nucleoside triphosphate hydrolase protein [Crassisporium funariophilum]
MSLLYDRKLVLPAKWTVKDVPTGACATVASLGRRFWKSLTPGCANLTNNCVCISIAPVQSSTKISAPTSFLCWAILDEEVDTDALAIPLDWCSKYRHIFDSKSSPSNALYLSPASSTPLTVIMVTALSNEAYIHAHGDHSVLDEWFSSESYTLRQGDIYSIRSKGSSSNDDHVAFRYRLEMLEPVLQGHALRGTTEIILALSQAGSFTADTDMDGLLEEQDVIEIDESFLGSSVLTPTFEVTHRDECQPLPLNRRKDKDVELALRYTCKPLSTLVNHEEDHYTLYLHTTDLGKIGILNGDWAIRVIANDTLCNSKRCVATSPLLLHNICSEEADVFSHVLPQINVGPSPFGSSNPTIPIARTVTIARVASPTSINRLYQPLFIHSLKSYFDTGKRLVKQGDIIAVPFDTDCCRWTNEPDKILNEDIDIDFGHQNGEPRVNEVVFFKVTNIEYEVMSTASPSLQDIYTGSTMGELGCWVDANVTRVIQTGVEHSRVPDVRSYLKLDTASSTILTILEAEPSSLLLGPGSPFSKILALSSAALAQRAVDYNLNLSFLLKGSRGIGKFSVASWVAQRLGLNLLEIDCYDILGETDVKTEAMIQVRFEQAKACTPCLVVLRHLEALMQTTQAPDAKKAVVTALRESINDVQTSWKITGYPVVVIGTTSETGRVPPSLMGCFKQEVAFEAPNEGERLEILTCLLAKLEISSDVSLLNLATQTAALLARDLRDLVTRAKAASIERVMKLTSLKWEDLSSSVIPLSANDFDVALGKARDSYSESIGAPKIPNVTWDDVGGLAHVKSDILDTIQLPLDHPELFADGLKKRSGILLYGPPGTGKTLIAKAVATSCSLNFFSVKGPELLNMYIGESEANVRRVFQRARDAKPCVIFFDELDSVAPKRGNHGDSGGVMDRIVSQLLAELDGMSGGSEGSDVFVIGATNRPDLLDPALLRPGRFDRMLYLGVSDTHEAQLNILEALTRKFRLDPDLDLRTISQKCPFNYTGADFYALCSDAMLNAMSRKAESIEEKIGKYFIYSSCPPSPQHPHPITSQYYLAELAAPEDITVYVSQGDFDRALDSLVPSVSQAEMQHYAQVQKRFSQEPGVDGDA